MSELSHHVTMASPPHLCDAELDRYLATRFCTPPPPPRPVFGRGHAHTAGVPAPRFDAGVEHELLATRPRGFLPHGRGHLQFAEDYAAAERGLQRLLADAPIAEERLIAMTAVAEIHENVTAALARAGLGQELFMRFLVDEPAEVIGALPTRAAALALRTARHRNRQAKWAPNDMNDVAYLACAVVHCDVVVTERHWVDLIARSGLDSAHSVSAHSDVAELEHLLAHEIAEASLP